MRLTHPRLASSWLLAPLLFAACSGSASMPHDHAGHTAGGAGATPTGAAGSGAHDHDSAGGATQPGAIDMAPPADQLPKGPATVAVSGDRWSEAKTWPSGKVPANGDSVEIPAGRTILVDVDPAALAGLTVKGTLVFDDRDVKLTTAYVSVPAGGRFQLGTVDKPFAKRATITLTGRDTADLPGLAGMGAKVFGVMDGIVDIHGTPVTASWTKLAAEAEAGATKLQLLEAPGWKVGDRIVVAASGYDQHEHDDAEIAAIDGTTVTLKAPLKFKHFGQTRKVGTTDVDVRAEVASLTRNVVITGDADSEMLHIGGHMMFMATEAKSTIRLSNIEVTKMGQLNNLGRYPIHFHVMSDRCDGCFVKDVAVHDTVQRGIVVHDTSKILVTGNVVFNSVGHNFIVETQTTAGNTFHRNLAMTNRMPTPAITTPALKAQNDDIPSGFWVRNGANVFTDNHVGGSTGMGMWLDEVHGGPLQFQRNTVHAAMTMGADRDFNMQSGVLITCDGEQPGATRITDVLAYQNVSPNAGAKGGAGFWPERCTEFHKGFAPFEIARIQAIDNNATNIELRHQSDVYTMTDVLMTGSLLGGTDHGAAVFAQYGGTVTLKNPTFAHYSRPVFGSNDILGPFIARFRIEGAKFIEADRAKVAVPESFTEALDDSFLPKGTYLVTEIDRPTLKTADCTTTTGDGDVYHCPSLHEMGFLVVRAGDTVNGEGEELTGGMPLHTVMPLTRADGAKFMPVSYGFGGYEIVWNTPMEYKLDQQPQGTITGMLLAMGSVTTGADEAANVTVAIPLAAAPKNVYRTSDGGTSRVPTPADRLRPVASVAELATAGSSGYFYDAGAKLIRLRADSRWFVVEP